MTVTDPRAYLHDHLNFERSPEKSRFTLDRMRRLVDALGHGDLLHPSDVVPPRRPHVVHVAGTKGKGGTSMMTAALLSAAGLRTGLYTSPHLEDITQRFRVDGEPIDEPEFATVVRRLRRAEDAIGERPTFFELTTAAAVDHFVDRRCDVFVMETGLGGRLDSTNVLHSDHAAVTMIGLDHQKLLGDTREQIAAEKAGIFKTGCVAISGILQADDAVRRVVDQTSRVPVAHRGDGFDGGWQPLDDWGGRIRYRDDFLGGSLTFDIPCEGRHQGDNAVLAVALAVRVLDAHGHPPPDGETITHQLADHRPPARLERFEGVGGVTVLLDAAHNDDSIRALVDVLRHRCLRRRVHVVLAATADKALPPIVGPIASIADRVLATRYLENPRWVPPDDLADALERAGGNEVVRVDDPVEALHRAGDGLSTGDWIVVCGSFFLAAELRPHLMRGEA